MTFFEIESELNEGGPWHSHIIACLIIKSWKDASFSSLSCLEKSPPSSLSVFPFCTQSARKKIRFVSERSLHECPSPALGVGGRGDGVSRRTYHVR